MGASCSAPPYTLPDQSGRTVVVTGGNAGIGFAAAVLLLRKGTRVIVTTRDAAKGAAAVAAIEAAAAESAGDIASLGGAVVPGGSAAFEVLELASLASVRAFAARAVAKEGAFANGIDCIVLNAGVMHPPFTLTTDGFELQWQTNHLGGFLLVTSLLPVLRLSTRAPTVVPVGSIMANKGTVTAQSDFAALFRPTEATYNAEAIYSDTKQANYLFCAELHRQHGSWLRVVTAHPGVSATSLFRHSWYGKVDFMFQSAAAGAMLELRAATDASLAGGSGVGTGERLSDTKWKGAPRPEEIPAHCCDADAAKALWQASVKAVGLPRPRL